MYTHTKHKKKITNIIKLAFIDLCNFGGSVAVAQSAS